MPICTTKDQMESFYPDRESHLEWRGSCIYLFRPSMDKYLIRKIDYFDWILCLFLGKFDMNQHAVINSYNTCSREHWAKAPKSAIYEKFEEVAKISLSWCFDSSLSRVVCEEVELLILLKGAIWGFRQAEKYDMSSSISKEHATVLLSAGSLMYWRAFTFALTPMYNIYSARPNFN